MQVPRPPSPRRGALGAKPGLWVSGKPRRICACSTVRTTSSAGPAAGVAGSQMNQSYRLSSRRHCGAHSGAWISRSLIRGPFPEHPLCPWLSRGWTVNQTKSLSSGATIPMVTMPRIRITRDLQTPSYLKRPVNLRESTSLLAGVFLAPFHR